MNKNKMEKMTERILNHTLEIIYLLTGEVSLLQHLTSSLFAFEINKDKMMTEKILSHALEIIYLLTGEEYTVVNKNSSHRKLHQLSVESDLDKHQVTMDENHQTLSTLEISTNRISGLQDENVDPVREEEEEDEIDEKDILKVTIHSDLCTGPSSLKQILPKLEEEEPDLRDQQKVKEEEIPIYISEDGSTSRDSPEKPHRSVHSVSEDIGVTESYQGAMHVINTPHEDGSNLDQPLNSHVELSTTEALVSTQGVDESDDEANTYLEKPSRESIKAVGNNNNCLSSKKNISKYGENDESYNKRISAGGKSFECSECGKFFSQKSSLVRHKGNHNGFKPFACSECGKCFTQKSSLVSHERIHTGVKPFECSQCGKCFYRKSNLTLHQSIHNGVKPFECSDCGKCFSQKSNLVSHEKIHTGVKPFECSECGKCFRQKSNLIIHQSTHLGVKPFECADCGNCFSQKSHLAYHERIHTHE